jgi:two-component system NarL family sensor kinase
VSAPASSLPRVMSTAPAAMQEVDEARPRRTSSRRVALATFALSGMALLIVIGTIGAVALRHVARDEALRDARTLTVALGRGVIRDRITSDVLVGEPAALRALDQAVQTRVLGDAIIRLKIWTTDGRIVYSDARELINRRFVLPEDLREALDTDVASAEVSDLARPENRFERGRGKLVEVYMPLQAASGEKVLLEAYHPAGTIDANGHRIWRSFLPVLFALLAALALAQLPLAWFLTRRVRAEEQDRERLRRAGEDALESERRRIAAELHDGVVQDLAGVAYELQATADRLGPVPHNGDAELAAVLRRGAGVARGSMRALRSLLVDLYPSERRDEGLEASVEALARPLRDRGVDVAVDFSLDRALPSTTAELVYRAVQESLRNVERHAAARTVHVALTEDGGSVTLVVADDGRGMTGDNLREQHAAGHMGLALLADGVAARGGSVSIESEPGSGTRVHVALPRV